MGRVFDGLGFKGYDVGDRVKNGSQKGDRGWEDRRRLRRSQAWGTCGVYPGGVRTEQKQMMNSQEYCSNCVWCQVGTGIVRGVTL